MSVNEENEMVVALTFVEKPENPHSICIAGVINITNILEDD